MKRLAIVLLTLTPWALHSMEPEEKTVELKQETVTQGRPSWVRLVEEGLPGEFPPAHGISQVLAQELLRRKPKLREFILDTISLPFRDFELSQIGSTSSSITFNATGDKMVTLSNEPGKLVGTVEIWEVQTGNLLHVFRESRVDSNPAGDKFIILSAKGARLWDAKTDEFITPEGNTESITTAMFTRAGDKVATGSLYGIAIWHVETGKLLRTLRHETWWNPVVFNRAGDHVATSLDDGTFMIWNVDTGMLLHTLKSESQQTLSGVGFNAVGDKLVTTNFIIQNTKIWDLTTEKVLYVQTGGAFLSPVGDMVALNNTRHDIDIRDLDDIQMGKRNLYSLSGAFGGFSPAGDKVVTLLDDEVIITDAETGEGLSLRHKDVGKIVFNTAGGKVLTIMDSVYGRDRARDSVRIWEVKTGKLIHIIRDVRNGCSAAAFNPAGDKVAVHLGDKVRMFDLEPLFTSLEFLTEITPTSITLRQVALLLDMYDVIERSKSPNASGEVSRAQRQCTFDFNNHPESIWDEYNALPEAIRRIFDPYITKPGAEVQAPMGS